jgi:hypothetical protein
MEQTFKIGEHVVMKRTVQGKAVKGAKGEIVRDLYSGFGTVSIRFQGTNDIVHGIPQESVKKQIPDPPEPPKDDFEVPKYVPSMSDVVLGNRLDLMIQRIHEKRWLFYSHETKQHVIAFLQAVVASKRERFVRMAGEALQDADTFALNER